ncbi:MAG: DEAD/DEAH box helicase [Candidatus Eremiobacteraeota bacterium]|nr:DEAD/DEAH box helicase [Candidatus Eremiobacteraeota bacterium]
MPGSFRLCLRIEEPARENKPWQVVHLLQHRDDPSLLIDAADAWEEHRYEFLTALSRAKAILPQIEPSLRKGMSLPWGFELDTLGVYDFLVATVPQLDQADIGVIVPAWWVGKEAKSRITVSAHTSPLAIHFGTLTADSLLDVEWKAALGEQQVSIRELQRLANSKVPLVQMRGQWVHLDETQIRAALRRLKNRSGNRISIRDIVRACVVTPDDDVELAISLGSTGPVSELLEQLQGNRTFEQLLPPTNLDATLRPYQLRGFSWLKFLSQWGLGACLADDMGLGKTIQALALVQDDWDTRGHRPVLLVCPTSVIGNWTREAQRFTPQLPLLVHHGSDRERGSGFADDIERCALVITSYALLQRDRALFAGVQWRGAILDEAQNIKNPQSKQHRAAYQLRADYRLALTGTPLENHIGDLWSIMEFLNPGMLGTQNSFKTEYFVPVQGESSAVAAERLKTATAPFILRRLKTDPSVIADLPRKQEMKVFCTLTREQASLYAAVLNEFDNRIDDFSGIQRRGMILALISKLKQICNHPAQFAADNSALRDRSGKLTRLEEMLEEVLDVEERALIFTQYAQMGSLIRQRLTERFGREVLFLHGDVPKQKRDELVERFHTAGGPPLFVLSLKAGGSGLNLTAANHVFHFDRWWNPAVENQATDRAFRIGQSKHVQVHKFVCAGTLEEKIDKLIESKRAITEQVVGSGESWLTELSSTQLREVLALAADAVEE